MKELTEITTYCSRQTMPPSSRNSLLKQSWRCAVLLSLGQIFFSFVYQVQQAPDLLLPEVLELDIPVQPSPLLLRPLVIFLDRQPYNLNHSATQRKMDASIGRDADEHPEYENDGEPEFDSTPCVPMKEWQTQPHPNCNKFHEMDLLNGFVHREIEDIAKGGWRRVFSYKTDNDEGKVKVALKVLRWSRRIDFGRREYEIHQMDAIVTDRLTGSPRIIDIYGFCAQSVFNEFADMDLSDFRDEELLKEKTWVQKLSLARDAALALADLHNTDELGNTTIAHRDLKTQNIIFVDGQLKLNDFNDAYLLQWNTTSNRQCGFAYQPFVPRWAKGFKPIEQAKNFFPLTENIDIYALGGILFFILLEHNPYSGVPDEDVTKMIVEGTPPLPPQAYRNSSDPSVKQMLQVIDRCYEANPPDRPTATWVADQIDRTLKLVSKDSSK
jgi:serine/threonine protein kinase